MKLSIKDKKLLYWLDQNSRATNKELGKKVGLTEQAIGQKIKRLKEKGIIKNFVTFVNTVSLGYTHYRVFLKLHHIDEPTEKEIISFLIQNPNIRWVASTSGKYDISFSVLAKNPLNFINIYQEIEKQYGRNIMEKNILINVRSPGFTRDYLLEKQKSKKIEYGITKQKQIDKTDENILKIISQDSRKNIVNIAREIKTSVDVVKYRLKKLKQNEIITGFTIQLDLEKIGYEFYTVFIYTSNVGIDLEKQMHFFAENHPNVLFVAREIGNWELEMVFEVRNYAELEKNLKEFRQQFSDYIRNFEVLRIKKEYKYDFFPFDVK